MSDLKIVKTEQAPGSFSSKGGLARWFSNGCHVIGLESRNKQDFFLTYIESDARRKGAAREVLQYLRARYENIIVKEPVPNAVEFWKKMCAEGLVDGFKYPKGIESRPLARAKCTKQNPPTAIERDIESPDFKKWFGKSVVREENKLNVFKGPPRLVYHGTKHDFKEFKKGLKGIRTVLFSEFEAISSGFFFSPSKADAKEHGGGRFVIAAFLRMERPLLDFYSHSEYGVDSVPPKLLKDLNYILAPMVETDKGNTFVDIGVGRHYVDPPNDPDWVYHFVSRGKLVWDALDNPKVVERMVERGYDGTFVEEPHDNSGYSFFVVNEDQIAVATDKPSDEDYEE